MSRLSRLCERTWLLLKSAKFHLDCHRASGRSTIILSAGIPRSGSTWLFNAARLLLLDAVPADDLSSGWIGDWARLSKRRWLLLKIHEYDPWLAGDARIILYSYRDIRDALASNLRKFHVEPTMELARKWLADDSQWRKRATFCLRYESMLADPGAAVAGLAQALRVSCRDPHRIVRQLVELGSRSADPACSYYYDETLLHHGHITDGRHGTWDDWLSPSLVQQIEAHFGNWLLAHGYPAGDIAAASR